MQAPPDKTEFGLLPRKTKFGDGTFPCYAERFGLLPRDEWQPVSMSRHVHTIYDQLNGMCTSNASTGAMMVERSFRGRPRIELSSEFLYRLHSKWGEGSSLDENLQTLINIGTVSQEYFPKASSRHGWEVQPDPPSDAPRFKLLEAVDLGHDFDAVATAIQLRKPCVIGVRWPEGGGGHAVCVTELVKITGPDSATGYRKTKVSYCLRGPNSWDSKWNEDGMFELTERECGEFTQFGAWCVGVSTG